MPIARPGNDEYAPHYGTYISKVTEPDVTAALIAQKRSTADLLAGLSEAQAAIATCRGNGPSAR